MIEDENERGSDGQPEKSAPKQNHDANDVSRLHTDGTRRVTRDLSKISGHSRTATESIRETFRNFEKRSLLTNLGPDLRFLTDTLKGLNSTLTNSLVASDLSSVHALTDTYRDTLSQHSGHLRSISEGLVSQDLINAGKSIEAMSLKTLGVTSGISETLRQIADASQFLQLSTASEALLQSVGDIARDFSRIQSQIDGTLSPVSRLLEDFRRQSDWFSQTTRSITSALAVSLLAVNPNAQMGRSAMDAAAWASVAFDAAQDRDLWELARSGSFMMDGVSILHEAEQSSTSEGVDIEDLVNRLTASIAAAASTHKKPSQLIAILQAIGIILTIIVPMLQMVQAHVYHVEEMGKPDFGPNSVEALEKHSVILREVVAELKKQTAGISQVVAVRTANVRQAPTTSSKIVGKLKQGDMAVLMATGDGWIEIEVADPLTNEVISGWVYSKLVARVIGDRSLNSL